MKEKKTCYHCVYFHACGDPDRTAQCAGYLSEEEEFGKVKEFFRDLKGTAKANGYRWIVTVQEMAELMGISYEAAIGWDMLLRKYHEELKTDRQGGGWVVE